MNEKGLNREWNADFVNYTEFMVNHPHYNGLFFERGADGSVKWVITGKSKNGLKRREWWNEQCRLNGIKIEPGCYAKIAAKIHPTKLHTCQICGNKLSVEYVYPNKRMQKSIAKEFGISYKPFSKDIFEIIDELINSEVDVARFSSIFNIDSSKDLSKTELKNYIRKNFVETYSKGLLSPGVMSNSPDRFDGFHSDGACCRHKSDKGRHKSNLQRYGQDRRVYENWADGNWKKADRLMAVFRKYNVSPDHIGPISLGFCHRAKFNPMTQKENSSKNNRMSLEDVKMLIEDEKKEQVVSWHSQFIWDKFKNNIKTDAEAKKLSSLMRDNLHRILIVFSIIDDAGYRTFLKSFLNPEYSFYDYKFNGFNPQTGSYLSVTELKKEGKNQENNVDRYFRIAFDELKKYKEIDNRKTKIWNNEKVDIEINNVINYLKQEDEFNAKKTLEQVFSVMLEDIELV